MRWPWKKSKAASAMLVLSDRAIKRLTIKARYDAAQTNDDNRKHWAAADGLSADASNTASVRQTLRNRSRYEVANNSYARGIVLTLANDTVGTGPRLQVLLDDQDGQGQDALAAVVEREFGRWAKAIGLAEKLRTMRMAKAQDGEAFALLVANPALRTPVELDIRLIEAEQVATPAGWVNQTGAIDGIVFDAYGNPSEYHVLRNHPGGGRGGQEFDSVPASAMIHVFRADRPGQHRGIPEIMPALPLFAQLRRFTLAVLDAAEMAADFAGVLYTDAPANSEAAPIEAMDTIELERRMLTTMPEGWKLGQIEAKQPATTYGEFKKQLLNEIARCLNMPFNIAAGNSEGYNYSSGRMDHQVYFKSIRVEQSHFDVVVLDRILDAWLAEAVRVIPELAPLRGLMAEGQAVSHQWFWDGADHVDPAKEANAQETRLANLTTTLAREYARQGLDWEDQLRQRAKELALMKELGLTVGQAAPVQPSGQQPPEEEDDDENESQAA